MSRGSAGFPSPRMRRESARPLSMISENPADDSTGASKVNVAGVARIGTKGIKGQGQQVQGQVMNSSNPSAYKNNNNSNIKNNMTPVPKAVPTRRKAVAPLQHPVTILLDKESDNSVRSSMTSHSPTSPRLNNGVVEHETNVFFSENGVAERNKKVPFLENGVSENSKRVHIPETTSTVSSIIKRFSSLSHDKNKADFDCNKSTNNGKGNTRSNPHSKSSSITRMTSESKDTNENPRTLSQNSSSDQDSGILSDNNIESPEILDGNHNDISWKSANNKTLGDSIAEEEPSGWVVDDHVLILTCNKHNNCNRSTPEKTDSASRSSPPHNDDSTINEIRDVNHLQNNDDDDDDDDISPASPELTGIDYSVHETKNDLTTSCCECRMKKMNSSCHQNSHRGLAGDGNDGYNDVIMVNNVNNNGNNNGAASSIQSKNQTTHYDSNTSNGSSCSSCSYNNTPYQSPSAHDDSVFIYSDNNHTQDDEICFLTSTPKFKTTATMVLSLEGSKNNSNDKNSYNNYTTTHNSPNLKNALTSAIEEDMSNSQQPPHISDISESKNRLLSQTPPPRPFHKAHSDSEAIKLFKTTNDQEFITDNNNKTHHCSSPCLDGETLEWKKRVTRSVSLIKAPSFTSDHNGPKRRISSIHPPGHHSNLSNDVLPEDCPTSFQNRFNDKSSRNNDYNTEHLSDDDDDSGKQHLNKDDGDNDVDKSKIIIQNISDEPVRRISAIDQSNFSLLKVATTRLKLPTRRASVTAWKEKYLNKQGPPLPSSDTTTTTTNNNNTIYTTTTTTSATTNQTNNNNNNNNNNSSTNNDSSAFDCKGTTDISSLGKYNESKSSDHTNTHASTKGDQWKLTEEVKNRINNSLAWLRQELIDIRIQDQSLARQFLDIREAMNDFRLVVECEDHQDLIQDVQEDMETIRELSQLVDIPTRDIQTLSSSLSPLRHVGVTRMNISSRRFSTC